MNYISSRRFFTACFLCVLLISPNFLFAHYSDIDPKVEQALLQNDWAKVYSLLNEVKAATDSSINKLIKGHAALALNKNNESLELFLTSNSNSLLSEWVSWTNSFVSKSSKNSISYYLAGDSKARLELWDESIALFSEGFSLSSTNSQLKGLILNARGVSYLAKKDWLLSKNDFESAIKLNPKFADVYSNLGFRFIARKDGISGALDAFNHALILNSDFALALHGKGCILSLFDSSYENVSKEFERAINLAPWASLLFGSNILKIQAKLMSISEKDLLSLYSGDSAGTTMGVKFEVVEANKVFNDYRDDQSQPKLNELVNFYKNSSDPVKQTLDNRFKNEIGSLDNEKFRNQLNNIDRTTHIANFFIPAIKTAIEVAGNQLSNGGKALVAVTPLTEGTSTLPGIGLSVGGELIKQYGTQSMERLSSSNAQRLETSKLFNSYNENHILQSKQLATQLSSPNTSSVFKQAQKLPDMSSQKVNTFSEIKSPGGVQINFSNALWKEGEWPFDAYFGLVYNTNGQLSAKN